MGKIYLKNKDSIEESYCIINPNWVKLSLKSVLRQIITS